MVVAADGSGLRQLTDTPELSEGRPAWSSDGSLLAYTTQQLNEPPPPGINEGPRFGLNLYDLTTGEETVLLTDQLCMHDFRWADPASISFSTGCGGLDATVQTVDVTTGAVMAKDEPGFVWDIHPQSGRRAYVCAPPDGLEQGGSGLCVAGPDGTLEFGPVTAAAFPDLPETYAPDQVIRVDDARWSADGETLVIRGSGLTLGTISPRLLLLPAGGGPGKSAEWPYDLFLWASSEVVVTTGCDETDSPMVAGCFDLTLVSYRIDTGESRIVMTMGCGAEGGIWSPDGQRLAVSAAQVAFCL
jgi:Tol biopolymer transport system component